MTAEPTLDGTFDAEVWLAGSWHFVSLPTELSDDIAGVVDHSRPGFGSVRVSARVGDTTWATSIFPDKARATYVLPVKKAVRTAEGILPGDVVGVHLKLAE